ncbi:polysaccharide deacetylase family protein [Peptoniphilus raoultii]|uniref:polysaccharide deacetylase family protein n=1 Tax=Peptoniphilus raoultii TaxID=1776387 RepID=UPI0008DB21FF|nr:polysaccharide deacetylase family protein [Peptoniphilus raoultii]
MEDKILERQLIRKRRARIRKRKRQIISIGSLLLIIFLIGSCSRQKIHNKKLSKMNLGPAMEWYIDNNLGLVSNKKLKSSFDIAKIPLTKVNSLKGHFLVKGSNHQNMASAYAYNAGEINSYIKNNSYKGNQKIVFLTFDDGPNTNITPKILDVLKENNVHATFFLVGKSINKKHYKIMKRILDEGNSIATHSYTHDYKTLYPGRVCDPGAILNEVKATDQRLAEFFGPNFKSSVFRYPGGHMSWENTASADSALKNYGVNWIDWNTLVGDAEVKSQRPTTAEGQVAYVEKNLAKNSNTKIAVVLAHDATGKELTVESLPEVINYFKSEGYKFGILK